MEAASVDAGAEGTSSKDAWFFVNGVRLSRTSTEYNWSISTLGKCVPGTMGTANPMGAPESSHFQIAASGSPVWCKIVPTKSTRQGHAA